MSATWSVESLADCTRQLAAQMAPLLAGSQSRAETLRQLERMDALPEHCAALRLIEQQVRLSGWCQQLPHTAAARLSAKLGDEAAETFTARRACRHVASQLLADVTHCDEFRRMRDDLRAAASRAAQLIVSQLPQQGERKQPGTVIFDASDKTPTNQTILPRDLDTSCTSAMFANLSLPNVSDDFSLPERVASQLQSLVAAAANTDDADSDAVVACCGALQTLIDAAAAGLLSADLWPTLRAPLTVCLRDKCDALATRGVQLVWQLLSVSDASTPQLLVQPYLCLLQAVGDTGSCHPPLSSGWPTARQLQLLTAITQWQLRVTRLWLRAPAYVIQKIIENTLAALAPPSLNVDQMRISPLLVQMALVDPRAEWFSRWLCSLLSRRPLVASLGARPGLMHVSVAVLVQYWRRGTCTGLLCGDHCSDDSETVQLTSEALYCHSCHVLLNLCRFIETRRLFPLRPAVDWPEYVDVNDGQARTQHGDVTVARFLLHVVQRCCVNNDRLLMRALLTAVEHSSSLAARVCESAAVVALMSRLVVATGGEWQRREWPPPPLLELLSMLSVCDAALKCWAAAASSQTACLAAVVFDRCVPLMFVGAWQNERSTAAICSSIVRRMCLLPSLASVLVTTLGFTNSCVRVLCATGNLSSSPSSPSLSRHLDVRSSVGEHEARALQLLSWLLPHQCVLDALLRATPGLASCMVWSMLRVADWSCEDAHAQCWMLHSALCAAALDSQPFCRRVLACMCRLEEVSLEHAGTDNVEIEPSFSRRGWLHTASVWATGCGGRRVLMLAGVPLCRPLVMTSSCHPDPHCPFWLAQLTTVCCFHLDGRVLLSLAVKRAGEGLITGCGDEDSSCTAYTSGNTVSSCTERLDEGTSSSSRRDDEHSHLPATQLITGPASVLRVRLGSMVGSLHTPCLSDEQRLMLSCETGQKQDRSRPDTSGTRCRSRTSCLSTPARSPHELASFLRRPRASCEPATVWLSNCGRVLRAAFCHVSARGDQRWSVRPSPVQLQLPQLLEQLLKLPAGLLDRHLAQLPAWHNKTAGRADVHPGLAELDAVVVDMILPYAASRRLLADNSDTRDALARCLAHVRRICADTGSRQRADWLSVALFVVFDGQVRRTCRCLLRLRRSTLGVFVWPSLAASRIKDAVIPALLRLVDSLLADEAPAVQMALRTARVPVASVCDGWLRQCYVGVLSWSETCHYLALLTALGVDYIVYFTLAVLRHLQSAVQLASCSRQPLLQLSLTAVDQLQLFCVDQNQLSFMDRLCRRYRRVVFDALNAALPTDIDKVDDVS